MESGIAKKNVNILLFLAVGILCSSSVFAEPVPIVPPNSVANNPVPAPRPAVGNSVHVPRPDVPIPSNSGNQCGNGNAGLGNNGSHNGIGNGGGNHGSGNNGNHNAGGNGNGNHGLGNNGNHNGIGNGNGNHGSGNNGNHNGGGNGNGNHGLGNNGNHNGIGNAGGNHGSGNNGNHNGGGNGNGNHGLGNNGNHNGGQNQNGNHDWGGKGDSDREHQYKEFNRKHNSDLPSVVGKYHNSNASCGGAGNSPKQPGHENNHGIEKVPQTNIISDDHSNVMTSGLGSLVGSDAKDKTVLPVQTSEVPLSTGTANTIDVNGDGLIHLETSTPTQPKSEVPSVVPHGHTSMTVQEVKQIVNDLVSLGSVAEAEVISVAKSGEVVLHPAQATSSSPTVEPSVSTIVNNPAPQAEISVAPSVSSVEKVSESISPNILDSSSSQTVINNPLDASLKNSGIESVSEYSNSGKPSQLDNTNQSLIVVGQVVKLSGNAIEIDQYGRGRPLAVGNNVHLGSKFKFTEGTGSLVIRSFTGELINVEV